MSRIILHIDMNSYFASVEQQANPHLRGKPVGVCEHLGGIIIAPSVEAKRLGIKLGTTVWDALKICPQIELLPTDPDKYRSISKAFMKILEDYTENVERYSIDEAFVDITKYCRSGYGDALMLALEIKQRLRLQVGEWVSCSIGVGPNKLIAKIAADLGSGDIDRICLIRPEDIPKLYDRLSLTDIPGIGPRLEKSLRRLKITSLRQLAFSSLETLLNRYGVVGYFLHKIARFEDTGRILIKDEDRPKSVGHAYTVSRALQNLSEIKQLMFKLSEKVARRMRKLGGRGSVVHYFHSDKQGSSFQKQRKLTEFISDGKDIYHYVYSIFRAHERQFPIKIMGVSISGLDLLDPPPVPLFEQYQKPQWILAAMDRINDKYGEFSLRRARLLKVSESWAKDTVGFGRTREVSESKLLYKQ